ncbi:hypothetical protein, partial [Burkholderia mallei]|uniref:hypothetical protein n=1 Tax=Burkholderia mallei TaxID=13373 RepID=UPI001E3EAC76
MALEMAPGGTQSDFIRLENLPGRAPCNNRKRRSMPPHARKRRRNRGADMAMPDNILHYPVRTAIASTLPRVRFVVR